MSWKSPNTRCTFSPGAAAESLPTFSKESSPSSPSKLRTSNEASSAVVSPTFPCGTTCGRSEATTPNAPKPSPNSKPTATTLSLPGASLAKISVVREKARDYAARVVACGSSTRASFAKFDPVSFSWKIPLFLFAGELSQYSGKWPRWGMMVRGECYPLPTWADAIGATAFGERSGDVIEYLTPCENGLEGGANGMTPEERRAEYPVRVTMKTRHRIYGTPTAMGDGHVRSERFKSSTPNLSELVIEEREKIAKSATWPTPCARDHHAGGPGTLDKANGHMVSLATLVEKGREKSAPWPTVTSRDWRGTNGDKHGRGDANLNDEVVRRSKSAPWPTPTCAGLDGGSHSRKAAKARGRYIANGAAESAPWPTPTVRDSHGITQTGKSIDLLVYAVERGETKSHTYPTIGTKTMGGCSGSQQKLAALEKIGALRADERRVLQSGNGGVATCGYLNPDWVEWLMNWPLGWTNPDAAALIWLTPEDDPADLEPNADGYIPRITTTKTNRVKRIETLGNGQFPLTACAAFIFGRAILAACHN